MTHKTHSKKTTRPRPHSAQSSAASRWKLWFGLGAVALLVTLATIFWLNPKDEKLEPLRVPAFSAENAFALLEQQCAFGPRVPNTLAHDSCRVFLVRELRKYADTVIEQKFTHTTPRLPGELKLTNIVASFNPQAGQRVLLGAHWDSRPWADEEADSSKHHLPIAGANDGASGVAILLEIARLLKSNPPPVGVDIILFDGEDLGAPGDSRSYAIGSQYYARHKAPNYNPMFGILLDMVGDRDLEIYQEGNSLRYAGGTLERVWNLAARLGIKEFIPNPRHEIFDDHIPFLEAGIPMVDLIDFDYAHWHTTRDTPDKCSAASLEKVGKVVLAALFDHQGL